MTRAEKAAKKTMDKAVSDAYRKVGNRITVPMMSLPAIFRAGEAAFKAGADVEEAVRAAVEAAHATVAPKVDPAEHREQMAREAFIEAEERREAKE